MPSLRRRHIDRSTGAALRRQGLPTNEHDVLDSYRLDIVWLHGETPTIEFADEPLARYRVRYQPDKKHLRAVEEPPVYETPSRSPQLALWGRDDTEWLKVSRRPDYAPRRPRRTAPTQAGLFP